MNTVNKRSLISWWAIASLILGLFFFAFYGEFSNTLGKIILTISSSALVASILLYTTKVQLSLVMLFVSELGYFISMINSDTWTGKIPGEFALTWIGIFSGLYVTILKLKRNKKAITFKTILNEDTRAFELRTLTRLLLLACMITVIFSLAPIYAAEVEGVTWINIIYVTLPTFIIILSVITCKDALYLRILYYTLWIILIQQAISAGMASTVNMLEPIVYLVTVWASLYADKNKDPKKLNK